MAFEFKQVFVIVTPNFTPNALYECHRCWRGRTITRDLRYEDVVNVTYQNVALYSTAAGPRLKGRRQGNATIRGVTFTNITLDNVHVGIEIDMDYETPGSTQNNSGVTAQDVRYATSPSLPLPPFPFFAIHFSQWSTTFDYFIQIVYRLITGSVTTAGSLQCLQGRPCANLSLDDIHIEASSGHGWDCK